MNALAERRTGFERIRAAFRNEAMGAGATVAVASILMLVTAGECHGTLSASYEAGALIPALLYGFVTWYWWAAVALILWWLGKKRPSLLGFSPGPLLIHCVAAAVAAVAHVYLLQETYGWACARWHAPGEPVGPVHLLSVARCGYGFAGLLTLQAQARKTAMQKLELERQLTQAQLKALQMQMEPHFLFNTLNALASLIAQGRNREAGSTLAHLNTILRTTLDRRAPEKVPFAEELHVIESYLAIQQVRFADRLQVKIDASSEAMEGLVPCFILQPIVENAIQHGIAPMEAGGTIETSVKRVGDKLWLRVRDNGRGLAAAASEGHGIGMRNTRERLAYFYPNAHEFEAVAPVDGGYVVTIQIPYERAVA
jgi:histidine kinase/histidine kinase/DNA gyrase B/HSP90-like ATPase